MSGTLAIVVLLLAYALFFASTTALPAEDILKRGESSDEPVPVPESVHQELKNWASFAAASYCDVENWDCGDPCEGTTAGTKLIKYINTPPLFSCHGYVAVNDKYKAVIVAFRGTAAFDSYVTDADIRLVDYDKCAGAQVHEGYYTVNELVSDELVPLVSDQAKKYPDHRIIVTGHSMGGAVATFHALDLIVSGGISKERLFLYTYGSPRIGDETFANFVDSFTQNGYQFFRAVNKNDIVPQLPPLFFGYEHYGPEYWWTENNTLVECAAGESPYCSNSDFPYLLPPHNDYFDTNMLVMCKHGT